VIESGLAVPAAAEEILEADDRSIALFLDVDGTLLDIAERPDRVETPPGLVAALSETEHKLDGALAVVSGRELKDIDRLFRPLRLRASAVHGAEIRVDPQAAPVRTPGTAELPASLWEALSSILREFPGTIAENKRYSFTVHYRLAPGAGASLRTSVMRLVESEPQIPIEVMNAHCAIELKSPGYDKGRAVRAFLSLPPFLGRTPVFIGDDTTDEAGFAVVSARGGFAFSVGRPRPRVAGVFERPANVRAWLAQFAERRARG
jgi:trehalose 6-phosphate phosphatase